MEKTDITVIGAGAVGLAVAERLARPGRSLVILEKNAAAGRETSSRNSEVIHAGIYYPRGTLKAELCVRGNALLYGYLAKKNIAHARCGKIIAASTDEETGRLERLMENAKANGVAGTKLLSRSGVRSLEPAIEAKSGLLSPSTGIFDTHSFLESLLKDAVSKGAIPAFSSEVVGIEKEAEGFVLRVSRDNCLLKTRVLVNCAGLGSGRIAALAGIDVEKSGYRLHFCKGCYFRLRRNAGVRRLVYPVPSPGAHGLGVHITPDLFGSIRLGPDARYTDSMDYSVDPQDAGAFCGAARRFLPFITPSDLVPDTSGIRPKLQGPGDGFRDFVIRHESDKGFKGLIDLVGIESPGLTASLAIAERVEEIVAQDLPF